MRDHGRIHCRYWVSKDIQACSDDAKLIGAYLLSSQHGTIAGAFRLPVGYVSEDIKWESERVCKGLDELSAKGFISHCKETDWIWIRKYLSDPWNPPDNPNQWKAVRRIASQIPDNCSWAAEFHLYLQHLTNPSLMVREQQKEPFPNKDKEQDKEQEKESEQEGSARETIARDARSEDDGHSNGQDKSRGTRIPLPFPITDEMRQWAAQNTPNVDVKAATAEFEDYWKGVPGAKGRKLDWISTWRNRMREVHARARGKPRQAGAGGIQWQ